MTGMRIGGRRETLAHPDPGRESLRTRSTLAPTARSSAA
jgi:hypothetical protein